jgi:hypothetical protein
MLSAASLNAQAVDTMAGRWRGECRSLFELRSDSFITERDTVKITKLLDQAPAADPVQITLQKNFSQVSTWIAKAADMVPADKYSFKATPDVRTFGQLIAHIADSANFFCARAAGNKVEYSDAIEKGTTDKATLVPKLKASLDTCNATYKSPTKVEELITNLGHVNLHYGNIITYMRLMGMVPPSS